MSRAKRLKMQDAWMNKVHWPIENNELVKCKYEDKIVPLISTEGLQAFREEVNRIIQVNLITSSPRHLRFGGQALGLVIVILGVVCMAQEEIVVGAVLALLGIVMGVVGFWYREQLIGRAWKKVGQALADEFKKMGGRFPGVSYEFHVQGMHRKQLSGNNNSAQAERRSVFYERYIIVYLPGEAANFHDYTEDKRSVAAIVKSSSQAVNERQDIVDENPLTLPYWWASAKTPDGKSYFINNLKHQTQWNPPTMDQIEMEKEELNTVLAPPGMDDNDDDYETDEDSESS